MATTTISMNMGFRMWKGRQPSVPPSPFDSIVLEPFFRHAHRLSVLLITSRSLPKYTIVTSSSSTVVVRFSCSWTVLPDPGDLLFRDFIIFLWLWREASYLYLNLGRKMMLKVRHCPNWLIGSADDNGNDGLHYYSMTVEHWQSQSRVEEVPWRTVKNPRMGTRFGPPVLRNMTNKDGDGRPYALSPPIT